MNIQALATELADAAYSGLTDAEAADSLNAANVTVERESVSGSDIYNALDPTEFAALSDAQKQRIRDIFGLGDVIDIRAGTNVRVVLLGIFGPGTATRDNLAAVGEKTVSRAEELGLGIVKVGHVEMARAL